MLSQISQKPLRSHRHSNMTISHLYRQDKKSNPAFTSSQQRFGKVSQRQESPGPGAYIEPIKFNKPKQLQKSQISHKSSLSQSGTRLDKLVSKEHQWIFGSNRTPYQNKGSMLGPGSYDLNSIKITNAKHCSFAATESWGKASRFQKGQLQTRRNSTIGPGTYQSPSPLSNRKNNQMGVFKSKSPKNYLDQLTKKIQKQNIQYKEREEDSTFEPFSKSTVDEFENTGQSQRIIKPPTIKNHSAFASKSKRSQLINPQNNRYIGPGSYQIFQDKSQSKDNKKAKPVTVSSSANFVRKPIKKKLEKDIGPTSYYIEQHSLQKKVKNKIASLKGNIGLQSRFKYRDSNNTKQKQIPGPGHYNKQKYKFIQEDQFIYKPLVNYRQKVDVPFLSSSSRMNNVQQSCSRGDYNLNQYDLGQAVKKQKFHIQRLKSMNIQLPGFQSSQRRTTFNLGKIINQNAQNDRIYLRKYQKQVGQSVNNSFRQK